MFFSVYTCTQYDYEYSRKQSRATFRPRPLNMSQFSRTVWRRSRNVKTEITCSCKKNIKKNKKKKQQTNKQTKQNKTNKQTNKKQNKEKKHHQQQQQHKI